MPEFDLDVLVIGGSGVDTIVRVPHLDMPVADSHMVPMVQTRVGHTGDNVALGCHALGLRTRLVDFLGQDAEGRMVREHHEEARLPCGWAIGGITKRAANLVDPAGRRMSFYDTRADADARLPEELWLPHARRSRHVHVSITHPSQFVLTALPPGPSVSTDLHNWDGLNPYHLEFAEAADIVFLSIAVLPDYERSMRQILRGRAQIVVATAGADGCYAIVDDGPLRHFPAAPILGTAIDSNGAGDAFVSGFLYGRLRGVPLEESIRFASLAGAHACTVPAIETSPLTLERLRDVSRETSPKEH